MSKKFLAFHQEIFGGILVRAFQMSRGTSWRENFELKNLIPSGVFLLWTNEFQAHGKKNSGNLSKLHFPCPGKNFEGNFLRKSCEFIIISSFGEKISAFWRKIFGKILKKAFYEYRGQNGGKKEVSEKIKSIITFKLRAKRFPDSSRKAW